MEGRTKNIFPYFDNPNFSVPHLTLSQTPRWENLAPSFVVVKEFSKSKMERFSRKKILYAGQECRFLSFLTLFIENKRGY